MDFNITAKSVAQYASRALGLVIANAKAYGGFPFGTFSKMYNFTVSPVISYGATIWGTREYLCINAVQDPACRFFLSIGKFTQNAAVEGDMGWLPQEVRQWNSVLRLWHRKIIAGRTEIFNGKISFIKRYLPHNNLMP